MQVQLTIQIEDGIAFNFRPDYFSTELVELKGAQAKIKTRKNTLSRMVRANMHSRLEYEDGCFITGKISRVEEEKTSHVMWLSFPEEDFKSIYPVLLKRAS